MKNLIFWAAYVVALFCVVSAELVPVWTLVCGAAYLVVLSSVYIYRMLKTEEK